MAIWITGSHGMLGTEASNECRRLNLDLIETDAEVDITDPFVLRDYAEGRRIECIINCAAYTAVDRAEEETDLAFRLNATGPANLAKLAAQLGVRFIHVSTDYVFDGSQDRPYRPDDEPNPCCAYGRSKLEGERKVFEILPDAAIVRTAWLYGRRGQNFVNAMLRLFSSRDEVKVVDDQRGSPTLADDLAAALVGMAASERKPSGIYHFTNAGQTTWYGFAQEILRLASEAGLVRRDVKLSPIGTDRYPTPAERPAYSVLDCARIAEEFGITPRRWQEALASNMARLKEEV